MGFSRSFNIYDLIFNAKNVFLGLNFANLYVKKYLKIQKHISYKVGQVFFKKSHISKFHFFMLKNILFHYSCHKYLKKH